MFWLEELTDVQSTVMIHFAPGVKPEDLPEECRVIGYHNEQPRWKSLQVFLDCHPNFAEAKDAAAEMGYKTELCPTCFNIRDAAPTALGNAVKLQVVVYAQGCVDPEVKLTFDEALAQAWYLGYELELKDEDLLTWQEVAIAMPEERE